MWTEITEIPTPPQLSFIITVLTKSSLTLFHLLWGLVIPLHVITKTPTPPQEYVYVHVVG